MDLSLLPLAFSLVLTVASRLLHPYSTDDRTSRLMVKILHSEGHPERFTELHGEEKRRGRKKIEVTRRRGRVVKKRETDLASNQFPKCSLQPGTPKEIHRVE